MSRRPKYPKRDKNDGVITEALNAINHSYRGLDIIALDTSDNGGLLVDRVITLGALPIFIEVKRPEDRENLTDGEEEFFARFPGAKAIVTSAEELYAVFEKHENLARLVGVYLKSDVPE